MPKRRNSYRSRSASNTTGLSTSVPASGRGRRGRKTNRESAMPAVPEPRPEGVVAPQGRTGKGESQKSENQTNKNSKDPQEPRVPLPEPVEQRWEETEGKYLHKKFKKMATSSVPEQETVAVRSEPSQSHPFPLKHSALSMLSSPTSTEKVENGPLRHPDPQPIVQPPNSEQVRGVEQDKPSHHVTPQPPIGRHVGYNPHPQDTLLSRNQPFFSNPNPVVSPGRHTSQTSPYAAYPDSSYLEKYSSNQNRNMHPLSLVKTVSPSPQLPIARHPLLRQPIPPRFEQQNSIGNAATLISSNAALHRPVSQPMAQNNLPVALTKQNPPPESNVKLPTTPVPMAPRPSSSQGSSQQNMATDLSSKKIVVQRIDKVISENQAIVETFDPLWTRRYMRQNSKDGEESRGMRTNRKYSMNSPSTMSVVNTVPKPVLSKPPIVAGPPSASVRTTPSGSVNLDTQTDCRPLELAAKMDRTVSSLASVNQPVVLIRQAVGPDQAPSERPSDLATSAQSVKEVLINSSKKPVNIAQMKKIVEGLDAPFHPSNPEKSVIKEILLKTRELGLPTSASLNALNLQTLGKPATSTWQQACVIDLESQTSSAPKDFLQFTPVSQLQSRASNISCSAIPSASPVALGKRSTSEASLTHPSHVPKHLKLEDNNRFLSKQIYGGGLVKQVEITTSSNVKQPTLLQISRSGFGSGGSIFTVNESSPKPASIPSDALQTIVSSATFTIPGIPTPSLSGVLTGIKSTPLFSLPGKRYESLKPEVSKAPVEPVRFVLGMPGPYSQASAIKSNTLPTITPATTSSISLPQITVSLAASQDAMSPVTIESGEKEDAKFLRPSSLSLTTGNFKQKKHVMLTGGATLVSPETPRPKKSYVLTYQNGTAYTHLGMKCSTKVHYCSTFKLQPMYVMHKSKLSMYSNWIVDKYKHPSSLSPKESLNNHISSYKDSYFGLRSVSSLRGKDNMIMTHSIRWNEKNKAKVKPQEEESSKASKPSTSGMNQQESSSSSSSNAIDEADENFVPSEATRQVEGGYKTTDEDYTYVRGRGRGRYVCNSCGIRCKKPSMLKKHIRTHSNFRPYTCKFCNFSFKTKGNLTKHMKSKAHHKKCVELDISPIPTTAEEAQGSESDNKQDEKLPNGETVPGDSDSEEDDDANEEDDDEDEDQFEDADEDATVAAQGLLSLGQARSEAKSEAQIGLGLTATRPKLSAFPFSSEVRPTESLTTTTATTTSSTSSTLSKQLHDLYAKLILNSKRTEPMDVDKPILLNVPQNTPEKYYFHSNKIEDNKPVSEVSITRQQGSSSQPSPRESYGVKVEDSKVNVVPLGSSKSPPVQLQAYLQEREACRARIQQENSYSSQGLHSSLKPPIMIGSKTILGSVEIIRSPPNSGLSSSTELSGPTITLEKTSSKSPLQSRSPMPLPSVSLGQDSRTSSTSIKVERIIPSEGKTTVTLEQAPTTPKRSLHKAPMDYESYAPRNVTMNVKDLPLTITRGKSPLPSSFNCLNQFIPKDLNTIAQIKAASVANANFANKEMPHLPISGVLSSISPGKTSAGSLTDDKPANMSNSSSKSGHIRRSNQDIITTNSEGKPTCNVCKKVFSKASQLRLHNDTHVIERESKRPYRCEDCGVSFRKKGHLVKHERSAGHFNKVNINQTFGTPSSSNSRPFECSDCLVGFRTHGHLAKHLRSRSHIMKWEEANKLPKGTFDEINVKEIDTTNCSSALSSIKLQIAEKLNDPSKLPNLPQSSSSPGSAPSSAASDVNKHPRPLQSPPSSQPSVSLPQTQTTPLNDTPTPMLDQSSAKFPRQINVPLRMEPSSSVDDKNMVDTGMKLCPHCKNVFPNIKDLQMHIILNHKPPNALVSPQFDQRRPGDGPEGHASSKHPTSYNGELLAAAANVVHMQQDGEQTQPQNLVVRSSSSSITDPNRSSVSSSSDGEEKSSFTCDLCGMSVPSKAAYKEHLLSHTLRPYVCSKCDAGFTNIHQLEGHKKLH